MLISKCFVTFLLVSLGAVFCKPTEVNAFEGRGIGSYLWSWVSYPFSGWGSEDTPATQPLVGSTTLGPYDNVLVATRNVTVWCNDQNCTTMKCDKNGCSNVTCNIYDTYLNGECRVYNKLPTETPAPVNLETTESAVEHQSEDSSKVTSTESVDEHPLFLEAAMSSTVQETPKPPVENEPVAESRANKVAVVYPQKV